MMKRLLNGLACFAAFVLLASGAGCGTAKSLYKSVIDPAPAIIVTGPDKSGLRKRVLLMPLPNQASISEKRTEEVASLFQNLLEKDPNILLEKTTAPMPSTTKMRSPKFGIVMDEDAARNAEEMGANALITFVMNPYDLRLKRTGIWPLRKLKKELEISVVVTGLDLFNGTLFLSNTEKELLDFKMEEFDEEEEVPTKPEMPEMDDKIFTRVLSRILERQASAVRSAMRNLHWTGKVLFAEGDQMIVRGGKKAGIQKDRVLEVFDRGDQVRTADGRTIYLLGPKIGEVKVDEVWEDSASVKPLTEAAYRKGQVTRAKR